MISKSQSIEVEVLEIDGAPPTAAVNPPPPAPNPSSRHRHEWQKWQRQIRKLDRRWWPLWWLLAAVVLVLLITLGVVLGGLILIFRLFRGILRALIR